MNAHDLSPSLVHHTAPPLTGEPALRSPGRFSSDRLKSTSKTKLLPSAMSAACNSTLRPLLTMPSVKSGNPTMAAAAAGSLLRKASVTILPISHAPSTSPRGSPFVPSPILVGEHLYMVNDMTSVATCFEAATGRAMWQGRLGVAQREGFSASPVAVNGKVFFTNDDGQTFVVQAGREFKLLHVNELGARTLASPALVDGTWYWRSDGQLQAIR